MKTSTQLNIVAIAILVTAPAMTFADDEEAPFDVAEVFFELNNTDGDLRIHALIDGDPWKRRTIDDTRERKVLNVKIRGRRRRQGLTEIFFESAEPTFDELPPSTFFQRFPAGMYEIEGWTLDGEELESETEISHALPAPAAAHVNGIPMALQCDDEQTILSSLSLQAMGANPTPFIKKSRDDYFKRCGLQAPICFLARPAGSLLSLL